MSSPAAAERRILAFLAEREPEILEFARDLIRTPSPNPPGDERAVADLVTARLRELGVTEVERAGRPPRTPQPGGASAGIGRRPQS